MRLRITKVDEFQFLICVKHEIWGSKSARFSDWHQGDFLAMIVDKQIAGLAEVSGEPFTSNQEIWDNGLFPNRIPIKFKYLFSKNDRPQILGNIRSALVSAWSPRYGWGILNQQLLDEENARIIIEEIKKRNSQNTILSDHIEDLLIEAKLEREKESSKKTAKKRERRKEVNYAVNKVEKIKNQEELEDLSKQEESLHSKAQFILTKIGSITGCKNFIASNDRKRTYKNIELSTLSLSTLPDLGLNKEATDRISWIDVIWLKQNAAICAFEVETSTSVYSGLLRMSDLLSVIPNLNIKLYVVAQKERKNKFLSELSRPTFQKIGLNDYCEFISIEDLEELLAKIENLSGHIQHSILDTIAIGIEE